MADEQSTAIYDANTTRILADGAEFHPVADIFPAMSDAEFRELVEDIREHGQREPVWILDDRRVIDGKHRVKACAELGRSVEARVYHGEGDAIVDFVLSLNMVRRHLSINQKLTAAHKAMPLYSEQARQRQGQRTDLNISANWRECEEGKAAHHVANLFGVSPRAVERAEAVYRDGAPELVQAFESDEVSVSAAAEVATLPDDEQREVVAAGPDAMKNAAKAVRDDYAAGLWAYALTGRQKLPVYKSVLYYTASKRYFRAPKTPRWGNLVLQHVAAQPFTEVDFTGWLKRQQKRRPAGVSPARFPTSGDAARRKLAGCSA